MDSLPSSVFLYTLILQLDKEQKYSVIRLVMQKLRCKTLDDFKKYKAYDLAKCSFEPFTCIDTENFDTRISDMIEKTKQHKIYKVCSKINNTNINPLHTVQECPHKQCILEHVRAGINKSIKLNSFSKTPDITYYTCQYNNLNYSVSKKSLAQLQDSEALLTKYIQQTSNKGIYMCVNCGRKVHVNDPPDKPEMVLCKPCQQKDFKK